MTRPHAGNFTVGGTPGPPHKLPVIVQKVTAFTAQNMVGPINISAALPADPTPGNQLIAILGTNIDAYDGHGGSVAAPGAPLGWTCVGSVPSVNSSYQANSLLLSAYQHIVALHDGKMWTLPIPSVTAAWMAALALYEVTPSGLINCPATVAAVGLGSGLSGQLVTSSSDALGSLGIISGICSAAANTAHAVYIDAVNILPVATWSADLDIYDPAGVLYNNLGTFIAPFIPPNNVCALALGTIPVNLFNEQAAALMLLFPPPV